MRRLFALPALFALACNSPSSSTPPVSSPAPIVPAPPSASAPVADASASAAPSGSAAAPDAPPGPFNVIVISIDSLRADQPWAGYPREVAPNLTALAKKSVMYTHAYSISSFTAKSLGGFVGGRFPSELHRTSPFFTKYLDDNVMFPEAMTDQGVYTLAGMAHNYMDKGNSGFEQGFQDWRVVPGITFDYNKDPWVTSQKMTPMAIEMLSKPEVSEKPFFAWFHYMDPHDVYQTHEESPHFGKQRRDLYDEEVFYTDLWIGKLMDWVTQQPWSKKTVVVFTADHGEAFGEHHMFRHAFELYEMLVRVPLFVLIPGVKSRVIDTPRSAIDLPPTFFDLLGKKPNPELRGKSIMKELMGGAPEVRDIVTDLPEDTYNDKRRTFMHGDWKIIAFGNDSRFELYNLKDDPDEKTDLFKKEADKAKEMVDLYKKNNESINDWKIPGGVVHKH